jgi:uncharacterized protein
MRIPAFLSALVAGLMFGTGLIVSGMTDPQNVLAFLDIAGDWNPGLAAVMATAIAVTAPALWLLKKRGHTLTGERCDIANRAPIDRPLVIGAVVFGIGWGMSGICPGPGLIIAVGGVPGALVFVAAMAAGMRVSGSVLRWLRSSAKP